ncbi:MAG: ATP synthase F1 subunit epsilon [bacterium]|nr:ATP synthase F1 subunit epsilon [bacterium]
MSIKKLKLKIVTPERLILEELVESETMPTTEGEVTILPDHVPMIAGLKSGDIVAKNNDEYIPMALVGGFVEVKKNTDGITEVAILADFAEHVSELSEDKIKEVKDRAEKLMEQMKDKDHIDFEHFESELERSLTRVKIADKWRTKKYKR